VPVTGRDIARKLGLAASTVSQALNDKGSLNPETVALVQRTALEMGYVPARRSRKAPGIEGSRVLVILSNTARGSHRTNLSGLDVRAIHGVETAVKERGATPALVSESQLADDAARGVSGAVVIGGYLSDSTAAFLRSAAVPAVMIASPSSEPNISSVQVDVIEGMRRATAYLHDLGHRHVALLNGPSATLASDHKLTGYLRALFDRGIVPDPSLVLSLERDVTGSRAIVREALDGALAGVTAVVCAYEELAIAALQAGREVGLRVPDDLSIIAYHDEGLAEVAVPPLTTIALPIELMARLAVSQLVTLAIDPDLVGTQLLVKATLRIRGSTAPAQT